jgi:putative endonuclease
MEVRRYYVYILTNKAHTVLYTGVTNCLSRRIWEHKNKIIPGFTSRYGLNWLIYFEEFRDINNAIGREKQIKGWSRAKKITLIAQKNSPWNDLSEGLNA